MVLRSFPPCAQVSRGAEFLYLTRGLTKKIRVDKVQLVVLWGNLELAFANSEELGIFTSALKYMDVEEGSEKEVPPLPKQKRRGPREEVCSVGRCRYTTGWFPSPCPSLFLLLSRITW